MPIWFVYAISAPLVWAIVNHIDKYVVSQYAPNKRPEALIVFCSLISGVTTLFIFSFAPIQAVAWSQAVWAVFAGMLFVAAYIPYLYALQEGETSVVAPLYQMIIPVSYFLGVLLLHETLVLAQIIPSVLVIAGSVLLTIDVKKWVWKGRIFKLMLVACVFLAFNTIIFKHIGLESSFWTASAWEYTGAFLFGLLVLCVPAYRKDFLSFVKEGRGKIVALNFLGEGLNVAGRMFFNFAALLAPIALVYVVSGTQPLFILFYSVLLYLFFPKIQREDFSRDSLALKITAIVLIIIGSVFLFQ